MFRNVATGVVLVVLVFQGFPPLFTGTGSLEASFLDTNNVGILSLIDKFMESSWLYLARELNPLQFQVTNEDG